MLFKDRVKFIRRNMKKNRGRVFMTVLATAMACSFLIILASVGFGIQRSVVKDIMATQQITEINVFGKTESNGELGPLKQADLDALKKVPHVIAVTPRIMVEQEVKPIYDTKSGTRASTRVVDFAAEEKIGLKLSAGKIPSAPDEVIIGFNFLDVFEDKKDRNAASKPAKELVGKTIQLQVRQFMDGKEVTKDIPLKVAGVTADRESAFSKDTGVYIGFEVLKQIENFTQTQNGAIVSKDSRGGAKPLTEEREYNGIQVYADSVLNVKPAGEEIKKLGYEYDAVTNQLKQINVFFNVIKAGLMIVGIIALLIASIGIYNTMTMAVTERAQDIGIMKAIGAHPKTIKSIFMIESAYIGLVGAAVGTLVSYIFSLGINWLTPIVIKAATNESVTGISLSYIPLYLSALCIAITVGVAMLSGTRPASRATKVDVLSALRRDI